MTNRQESSPRQEMCKFYKKTGIFCACYSNVVKQLLEDMGCLLVRTRDKVEKT